MVRVLILSLFALQLNCGVKGDPQPPVEPPELGRGRPTYDKASKELIQKEKNREDEENKKKK